MSTILFQTKLLRGLEYQPCSSLHLLWYLRGRVMLQLFHQLQTPFALLFGNRVHQDGKHGILILLPELFFLCHAETPFYFNRR